MGEGSGQGWGEGREGKRVGGQGGNQIYKIIKEHISNSINSRI